MISARLKKMAFEDWVRETLDSAVIDAIPEWLNGLSERARICLLAEGFNSLSELKSAIENGFDLRAIDNGGLRVQQEILQWLK